MVQALASLTDDEREVVEDDDFSMWMSLHEAVSFFKNMTVCRVRDWCDMRVPGKFIRVCDVQDSAYEAVLSKWYYQVQINKVQP